MVVLLAITPEEFLILARATARRQHVAVALAAGQTNVLLVQ